MSVDSLNKNSSAVPSSIALTSHIGKQVGPKNMALAITLIVVAVLLIIAALVALFVLPHFGINISPLFGLLAIPVLVGLVKMAIAIFILHKPTKQVLEIEEQDLKNYFVKTYDKDGKEGFAPLTTVVQALKEKDIVTEQSKEPTESSAPEVVN